MAGRKNLKVPHSKMDFSIAESLVRAGYLKSSQKKGRGVKKIIAIELKYGEEDRPVIRDIKFISRPSKRVYRGYREIRRSKQGYGRYFISTPRGILNNLEAKKMKVGGELLFEIW